MKAIQELKDTCPTGFEETWEKYPKLRHLMMASSLFEYQHVEWMPYPTAFRPMTHQLFPGNHSNVASQIYTEELGCEFIKSEIVICKGEIKSITHYNTDYTIKDDLKGELELKIGAFVASSFKKMSCIITVESICNIITGVCLHPDFDYIDSKSDSETYIKAVKKLYTRRDWTMD